MPASLSRLLRLRRMQEELARMELEAEAARLRALERLASEAGSEAEASRRRWFLAVERESPGAEGAEEAAPERKEGPPKRNEGPPERLAEEAAWELAVWRRALLEARRPVLVAELERARAEFLDGRRERRTVESLVEAAAKQERLEDERRVQRGLDDWYLGIREAPEEGPAEWPEASSGDLQAEKPGRQGGAEPEGSRLRAGRSLS